MYRVKYVLTLILNYALVSNALDANLVSPCPKLFVYRHQDNARSTWYGTLIATTDEKALEINTIRVILDREAEALKIYDQFAAITRVEASFDNTEFLINGLQEYINKESKLSITIAVVYRQGAPAPKLITFSVNDVVTCSIYSYLTTTTSTTKRPLWSIASAGSGGSHRPKPRPTPRPIAPPPLPPVLPEETCGTRVNEVAPLIIGGVGSKTGEWPWHGALYSADVKGLNYQCGATLISKRSVITAAHCVTNARTETVKDPGILHMVFGRIKLSQWNNRDSQTFQLEKIIIHPEYNSTNLHNDLAIIRLSHDVQITSVVRPACLWSTTEDSSIQLLTNRTGTVVGWGVRSNGETSEELQYANIPVIDPLTCIYTDVKFYTQYRSPKSYCAGILGETSACNGDSGGGMVFKKQGTEDSWQLRGIVSLSAIDRETNLCDIKHYVVFTDVAFYLDWLHRQIPEIR